MTTRKRHSIKDPIPRSLLVWGIAVPLFILAAVCAVWFVSEF
jgi:hypothetical protein